jgi:hypothetical protein
VNPLLVQRSQYDLHPFGADLGLHQRNPKLLTVHRAVSCPDPHQLLKGGMGKLCRHLGWLFDGLDFN